LLISWILGIVNAFNGTPMGLIYIAGTIGGIGIKEWEAALVTALDGRPSNGIIWGPTAGA